jgi:hypothetical protein
MNKHPWSPLHNGSVYQVVGGSLLVDVSPDSTPENVEEVWELELELAYFWVRNDPREPEFTRMGGNDVVGGAPRPFFRQAFEASLDAITEFPLGLTVDPWFPALENYGLGSGGMICASLVAEASYLKVRLFPDIHIDEIEEAIDGPCSWYLSLPNGQAIPWLAVGGIPHRPQVDLVQVSRLLLPGG